MSYSDPIGRRRFLALGGTVAAAALLDPLAAVGATTPRWPSGRLTARDATRVRASEFMPTTQFRTWHAHLDAIGPKGQKGLRATGSPAHEAYVDDLVEDLRRAGVKDIKIESVPMERWTATRWSLTAGGAPVRVAAYVPYSGATPAAGVSGPLAYVDAKALPAPGSLAGRIAVFDVPLTIIPLSFFAALAFKGYDYDPKGELLVERQYKRPYLNGVIPVLDAIKAAGALGAVGVLDYPAAGADGSYFPYDGEIRGLPALYVDRDAGAALKAQAQAGAPGTLALPAETKAVKSRNVIGLIPGRSSELVALHCHTDGSNAIEDNGPGAIVAMAQYLARLPKSALPRTIMIVLTTGHFAGGNGSRAFVARHEGDLVKRTKAALTIEHLGLREHDEVAPGRMGATGRWEPGAIFAPGAKGLADASLAMLKQAKLTGTGVLRPLDANAKGDPNAAAWPGEGQYLYAKGGIPTANYITGPTYLLNWGIETTDKVSFARVRTEAIAFTDMILRLGRTERAQLTKYTL